MKRAFPPLAVPLGVLLYSVAGVWLYDRRARRPAGARPYHAALRVGLAGKGLRLITRTGPRAG